MFGWVILCSSVWLLFPNERRAQEELQAYSHAASLAECLPPQEASQADIAFYVSAEFKPMRVDTLAGLETPEALAHAADPFDVPPPPPPLPSSDFDIPSSEGPDPTKASEPERECAPPEPVEKKCRYWFVWIGPHALKMKSRCWKVKLP